MMRLGNSFRIPLLISDPLDANLLPCTSRPLLRKWKLSTLNHLFQIGQRVPADLWFAYQPFGCCAAAFVFVVFP